MRRGAALCLIVGVVALAVAWWRASGPADAGMPSYLACWLFFLAAPLGALPVVMALELAGAGDGPLPRALRRLLPALPIAALLAIPLLLGLHSLYGWSRNPLPGFAGAWLRPGLVIGRWIVLLAVWCLLGLIYMRPSPPGGGRWRRALAGPGLLLHLVMATLAAVDWLWSLQPQLNASVFGLLVIVIQCGIGVSVALLLAAVAGEPEAVSSGAGLLLALLGAWMFLQFSQFLVIWSADLPNEIVWYQQREAGLGRAAEWFALLCFVLPLLVLLPRGFGRSAGAVAAMAALVLLLHLVEAWWLVTPAFRGRFSIAWSDLLLLLGIGGVVIGCVLAFERAGTGSARRAADA